MGNGSSRGSVDYYPFPPIPGPHNMQPGQDMPVQMPVPQPFPAHPQMAIPPHMLYNPDGSRNSGSVTSYDRFRKRKPWYSLGRRKNKYGGDLWYNQFAGSGPGGPVVPAPPPGYVYSEQIRPDFITPSLKHVS